jgi:CheY-like chemotaxis protein
LANVITEVHNIISRVFDKSIQIEVDLKKDLFVRGNHTLLSQIFMNLFTNARDAMPEGGKLGIEAIKQGDKVIANVSDMGCGMDKETLERIFDPFFTLKEVGKGTGLGLSTTHGIVEQHDGTISVKSELGKGTTFTICFPLAKGKDLPKSRPQKELIIGKDGQRVLIVDDERPALDALTHLSRSLGYEAIPIEGPAEALKNYEKWAPDVVLMDRNMPEMSGISCVKELVRMDPNAKIIIVSGYDGSGPDGIDEDVRRLIKGYLTKPFKLEELSAAIDMALK